MIDLIISEASEKMDKSVDALKKDLKKIRTGRASLSLLDDVRVNYYNTPTPLNQLASLSVPESRMITIQPWDPSAIKEIEKAIMKSNLGLTPSSDGKIIRITMPPLTEDRRKDIVKQVNKVCEEYRIAVRNIRREANDSLKTLKKDGDASEDDVTKAFDQIQKLTDEHVKQIDDLYKDKEKEILEV
ncbi:ribosome recycling factor [Desulfosalsimonas propionicica]|uniref:Ribosome-recycling factor n=1 Tax=Desulfosalsimonas propionicica TaxID=332175 RepID=A0A7W0C832_9BACT|nr:ribosome recycling factor [Desulfosalsimonas propionicica]MBA2880867.1 ribosome recycling factor [Desulfosalsimonas propionicica]